jgi:peptidoglycan hydrolase-like protein with peptidoglycan-binding domain|tara:strand:+ start:1768 stop:2679 length:912 start_codon:yes stop_codon:yes gene_type:complete
MRYWELKESVPEEDANDPRGQDQRNDPNAPVDVSKADANDLTATLTQGPPYPPEQMDGVRKMQSQLIKIGYSVGRTGVDGKYGPLTSKGVAAFKKDYNETGDGSELTGTALAKLAKVESGALPKVANPTNSGNPKPFGGAELAELDFGGEQNEEAKAIAETFLGREMKEQEWNALVRATVAEASPDSKEQAAVMAVILNRSNSSKYPDGVMGVLTQKNQFQAVTGTPRNRAPSRNFSRPSSQQIASVVNAVINHLPNANKTWLNFTANNPRAYGAGTNIDFMYAMRQSPGAQVIGGTVFGNVA